MIKRIMKRTADKVEKKEGGDGEEAGGKGSDTEKKKGGAKRPQSAMAPASPAAKKGDTKKRP